MKSKYKKVYIIGHIPKRINNDCIKQFAETQLKLIEMGFNVINPIEKLAAYESVLEARKKNYEDLLNSYAVYIMPNTDINNKISNIEIRIALQCNLLVIHSLIKLNSDKTGVTL